MVENKIIPSRLSLGLSLILLSQCTSNVPDVLAPERILHNGKIVTVDQDFSIAQAVAIRNGRFLAVGFSPRARPPPIAFSTRTVYPLPKVRWLSRGETWSRRKSYPFVLPWCCL